jgi:PBSX family phage terminase large subunit
MTEFALMPKQFDFVTDQSRFAAYIGGIGSGKTYAGAVKVLQRLNEPGYGMIAAPTFPMLRDSTRRSLIQALDSAGIQYDMNKSENSIKVGQHEIICRSLDNPETLRGPNLQWAWIDEAALVSEMAWRIVKGRVREGDKQQAWITTTPKGRNWIWKEWVAEPDANHTIYKTRTTENKHLDPDFAASLDYDGLFAEQELAGEFVAFEGLVYPQFQREMVKQMDCDGWRTVIGGDLGASHPTVVLVIRLAGDGRVHIESEICRPMNDDQVLEAFTREMDRTHAERVWIDPSAKGTIDALNMRGYPQAQKADNDIKHGLRIVGSAFTRGLTVDPSCVYTIAEFESYQWPTTGTKDVPVDAFNHCMDSLRYALVGEAVPQPTVRLW